jgi:hypothetical protein
VSGKDVPKTSQPVEVLFAVRVGQDGPFPLDPHVTPRLMKGVVKGVNQVRTVAFD